MLSSVSSLLLLSSALVQAAVLPSERAPSALTTRSLASNGTNGAVVSEVAECSDIGVDMLKIGGSAADAIIATSLCVGTISAYHSGIGGGGFMLVRSNNGTGNASASYEMIDFRETTPALGNETMYTNSSDPTASTIGGLSVGTPGEIRGWQTLHERHGKLPWATLFEPAIILARDGFRVNIDLADALDEEEYPFLVSDPLWAESYAPNGTLLQEGDTAYRKRYANALSIIASEGPDAFYNGTLSANISAAAINAGGILSEADLANYTTVIRTPSNITYRDKYRIYSTVAPSSGSIVLSTLKIFEGFSGNASVGQEYVSEEDPGYNLTTHRIIQATKFGYGQRTNFGDPAFTANVSELEQSYLTDDVADQTRAQILDDETFDSQYYDPSNFSVLIDHGTSHLAAVDSEGNAISLTTTVNLYWGSTVMTEDGIVLNDEMDDFSSPGTPNAFGFTPSPINYIRPFKRPQSSISSSIAEDIETGELVIATGSAGGSRIITATLQNLHNVLDLGASANASVHTSRWHDQLGSETYYELPADGGEHNGTLTRDYGLAGIENGTVAFLEGLGYNMTAQTTTGSTSHVIVRNEDGSYEAANDPRKSAGGGSAY